MTRPSDRRHERHPMRLTTLERSPLKYGWSAGLSWLLISGLTLTGCLSGASTSNSYASGSQLFHVAFPRSLGRPIVRHEGATLVVEANSRSRSSPMALSVSSSPIDILLRHEQGQPAVLIARLRTARDLRRAAVRSWKQSSCRRALGNDVPLPPGGSSSAPSGMDCRSSVMAMTRSTVWFVDAVYPRDRRGAVRSFLTSFRATPSD